jgi:hypothetical protein
MLGSVVLLSSGGGGSIGGDFSAAGLDSIAVFGDSISLGAFADGPSYVNLLGNWFNITKKNSAVSGSQAGDMAFAATSHVPAMNRPTIAWVGANDARLSYPLPLFEMTALDLLVKTSVYYRVPARSATSETGTWSNTGVSSIGRNTTSIGATSTFSVNGDAVYIGFLTQENVAAGGTADVTIDGNFVGTIDTDGTGATTNNGLSYPSGAVRFDGLGSGAHTVEIEVTSSGLIFYLEYVAGSNQPIYPPVYAGNVMKQTSPGPNDATSLTYSNIVAGLVADLAGDGLDVSLVDLRSDLDPLTDYADYIHPDGGGHLKIFELFRAALI